MTIITGHGDVTVITMVENIQVGIDIVRETFTKVHIRVEEDVHVSTAQVHVGDTSNTQGGLGVTPVQVLDISRAYL